MSSIQQSCIEVLYQVLNFMSTSISTIVSIIQDYLPMWLQRFRRLTLRASEQAQTTQCAQMPLLSMFNFVSHWLISIIAMLLRCLLSESIIEGTTELLDWVFSFVPQFNELRSLVIVITVLHIVGFFRYPEDYKHALRKACKWLAIAYFLQVPDQATYFLVYCIQVLLAEYVVLPFAPPLAGDWRELPWWAIQSGLYPMVTFYNWGYWINAYWGYPLDLVVGQNVVPGEAPKTTASRPDYWSTIVYTLVLIYLLWDIPGELRRGWRIRN
jgi:hypothetical protein